MLDVSNDRDVQKVGLLFAWRAMWGIPYPSGEVFGWQGKGRGGRVGS